jgi:hypothetical protein
MSKGGPTRRERGQSPLPDERTCQVGGCNDQRAFRSSIVTPDGGSRVMETCGTHVKQLKDSPYQSVITTTPINRKG